MLVYLFLQWVEPMADAGADQYTFHIEATSEPAALARKIKEAGMKVRTQIVCKYSTHQSHLYTLSCTLFPLFTHSSIPSILSQVTNANPTSTLRLALASSPGQMWRQCCRTLIQRTWSWWWRWSQDSVDRSSWQTWWKKYGRCVRPSQRWILR